MTKSLLCLLLSLGAAAAQGAVHTFDSDAQGWLADAGGSAAWSADRGGILVTADTSGTDYFLLAPPAMLGDWSGYLNGSISFDVLNVNNETPDWGTFGTIVLSNGSTTLSVDTIAAGQPPADGSWHHYEVPLTVAVWGAGLSAVLGNVTGFSIGAESHDGISEVNAFDNIAVAPVPEPAAATLLAVGLAGIAAAARRRRS